MVQPLKNKSSKKFPIVTCETLSPTTLFPKKPKKPKNFCPKRNASKLKPMLGRLRMLDSSPKPP
jgi:hypothetical protein